MNCDQAFTALLRIFHYSPWYTYRGASRVFVCVENLSLFALIYLSSSSTWRAGSWESFIIRLDILSRWAVSFQRELRIFHYSPWYTYPPPAAGEFCVENLSLFALIYLTDALIRHGARWESFIIRLDILTGPGDAPKVALRIFHYSPWYTYLCVDACGQKVENLSLFALIYLGCWKHAASWSWESFIIRLDILNIQMTDAQAMLRIFHYSPWYT